MRIMEYVRKFVALAEERHIVFAPVLQSARVFLN